MKNILTALLFFAVSIGASAQSVSSEGTPAALLAKAREVMGFAQVGNRVLHYHAGAAIEQNYQSDRNYPPFFSAISQQEIWLQPATGVLRVQAQATYPGGSQPASVQVDDGVNVSVLRGEQQVPVSRRQATARNLSAWAVIADWSKASDVRIAGREAYRDYPRIILTRPTPDGEQRLYLDPKSGFPVKLDLIEPHYLWGQRQVEYVWSTWIRKAGVTLPGAASRVADADVEISQTIGEVDVLSPDAAPSLAALAPPAKAPADLPMFLQPIPPQATQLAPNLLLLSNPGYNELVTMASGELYIFDATQGEDRARQDAAEIAKSFPPARKINIIVTDTAWPHVAGLRYWVSRGATVISHPGNREFLERVVNCKWTLKPDSLEQLRSMNPKAAHMNFVAIDRLTSIGAGAVQLVPIDGIASELALMAYVPAEKFLWASDYIQTVSEPSLYAAEVMRAAERAGIVPERVAAEHLSPTEWKTVQAAQAPKSRVSGN